MRVLGIENQRRCVLCSDGEGVYNCGETLEEFGIENLTERERRIPSIRREIRRITKEHKHKTSKYKTGRR